jgi:hypothetical protein
MAYYNSHQTRKNPRSPGTGEREKNTRQFRHTRQYKKTGGSISSQKTHKLNKKSTTYKRRHKAQNHTKRKYNNQNNKTF